MAKPKKEVVYQADAGKSDYSDSYGTQTSYKKTKKDSSGKGESTASADLTTGKGNVLPEFELAVTKMYGSPARMDTVDPTTGQVLPTGMGQGPTNVGNANTAQTLQNQADAEAVKANRAGVPSRSASSISQTPMTMQGNFKNDSMAHASRMFGNVANPVPSPSQFNKGLKILNSIEDPKHLSIDSPRAQFKLYKLYATISKKFIIPKINTPITLSTEMDSQISEDTLYGSEQFSVGGYYSVRSFRENNISGDDGYYLRNKAKINLGQLLASKIERSAKNSILRKNSKFLYKINFEPFYDYGYVKIRHNKDSGRLSGAGLKTTFSAKNFDASLTSSWSIGRSQLISSDEKENKMIYFELKAKCCN